MAPVCISGLLHNHIFLIILLTLGNKPYRIRDSKTSHRVTDNSDPEMLLKTSPKRSCNNGLASGSGSSVRLSGRVSDLGCGVDRSTAIALSANAVVSLRSPILI